MTPEAVFTLALKCLPPVIGHPPVMATIAAGIAQHENPKLDPNVISRNANGTFDYGLAQINTVNLGWLGLTPVTVLDPCRNLRAAIAVLFARYNGNGTDQQKILYAAGAMARIAAVRPVVADPVAPIPPPCAPAWDAWALAACNPHQTKENTHEK